MTVLLVARFFVVITALLVAVFLEGQWQFLCDDCLASVSGGVGWWRVCYQPGLPRLVSLLVAAFLVMTTNILVLMEQFKVINLIPFKETAIYVCLL